MDWSGRGATVFLRVVIVQAFVIGASAPMGLAQELANYPTTLQVRLYQRSPAKDVSLSQVAEELRAIWAPYLEIVVTVGDEACPSCTDEVRVHIDDASSPSGDALGWINFEDRQPTRDIAVSLARVRQLVRNASWMGRPVGALPPSLAMRVLARGVGRVIAHEIGHYILRSALHQPTGLMRAKLNAGDIVRPQRDRLRLPLPQLERSQRSSALAGKTERGGVVAGLLPGASTNEEAARESGDPLAASQRRRSVLPLRTGVVRAMRVSGEIVERDPVVAGRRCHPEQLP